MELNFNAENRFIHVKKLLLQNMRLNIDFWNNSLRIIPIVKQQRWCPIYKCVINRQWLITFIINSVSPTQALRKLFVYTEFTKKKVFLTTHLSSSLFRSQSSWQPRSIDLRMQHTLFRQQLSTNFPAFYFSIVSYMRFLFQLQGQYCFSLTTKQLDRFFSTGICYRELSKNSLFSVAKWTGGYCVFFLDWLCPNKMCTVTLRPAR